ncbi:hypothetical protein BI364_00535 [Acidihalobacter yilgarnensis]|uniref:Mechanosensitive ion channel protein MscS n=1 Tax=Acidihalobacter yilgarnensis TaxID=2819280 RepID=A0A1D8IJS7_9GAMM|nr:mechanosensitive ion channel domain-containing protein [Acidihalobacter yilgarnensis]AOU96705.1 hypothetical protein BI364_00535 [Acidihalobacter yilgarnensis]
MNAITATFTPDRLWQLAVVALALTSGWLAHRLATQRVAQAMGNASQRSLRRILLRGSERLAFPLAALVVTLSGSLALQAAHRPGEILELMTPLLLSLAAIRLFVYFLRQGLRPGPALRAWEQIAGLSIWAVVALHLLGWLGPLGDTLARVHLTPGEHPITLLTLFKATALIGVVFLLTWWIGSAIERQIMAAGGLSASLRVGIAKVIKFAMLTFGLLLGLNLVGIDLTAFTVFGGALGVGLGLGLQRIASNLVSGFILLFDRSIRPGDVISIGDRFGWVQELRARYIVVRDRDGVETLIPNENLITSQVINWSYSDRKVRLKSPVTISYDDDPELAMRLLEEIARTHPRILDDPPPGARLLSFEDNGMRLELRAWIADPEAGVNNIRSALNLDIWRAFKAHGITIPYPQRVVYLHDTRRGEQDAD